MGGNVAQRFIGVGGFLISGDVVYKKQIMVLFER